MSKESFVYLLLCSNGSTYIGATIDLNHRLRQHNKELKGGAHATSVQVEKGHTWKRACHVSGFPDWQAALQFEWRWKQLSRKFSSKMNSLERRMKALEQLLTFDSSTTKALPYSDWPTFPEVHMEI
jgi:structure-specific endonuclease subunit SLX1